MAKKIFLPCLPIYIVLQLFFKRAASQGGGTPLVFLLSSVPLCILGLMSGDFQVLSDVGHTFKESSNSSPCVFTRAVTLPAHVWRGVKGICRLTTGQLPDSALQQVKSATPPRLLQTTSRCSQATGF